MVSLPRLRCLALLYQSLVPLAWDNPENLRIVAELFATAEGWSPAPPSEILGIARRAADLSPGSPRILDTLAAAQANAGDFPAAMATASRALALVPPGCPLIPLLSSHLDLYRSAHSLRQ